MVDFLPDIEAYLESIDNSAPVDISELDNIVETVMARTGLDKITAETIVRLFFQEIRNAMLRGEKVTLRRFGAFYIASPIHGNKQYIFPKFKPYKKFIERLNGK